MLESLLEKLRFAFGPKAQMVVSMMKSSFRLLGDDEIRQLLVARLVFALACHIVVLLGVSLITFNVFVGWGVVLLLLSVLVLYPYSFFYHVRMRARQTWFSYASITHHQNPLEEAGIIVGEQRWRLRVFAVLELAFRSASSANSGKKGGWRVIVGVLLAMLEGMFDIAKSYLMPAVVIDRLTLSDAITKLKELKGHIPQTLAGSFGLDLFGGVVSSLLTFIYIALFGLGAGASYVFTQYDIVPVEYMIDYTFTNSSNAVIEQHVFIFPVLVACIFISLLRRFIEVFVTSIQASYFAIFYTRINHADEIDPTIREQIDSYLTQPGKDLTINA